MLSGGLYLAHASRAEVIPPREGLARLPMEIDGWSGRREPDLPPRVLEVLSVDDYIVRTYFKEDAGAVGLYVGYHSSQRQGTAIHSPLNCLPGAGWQPLEIGRATIPVQGIPGTSGPTPIEVNRVIIGKGLDRQLVFYWYQSHRRIVASEYWGKVYSVLDAVRYNRTDAALVRVVAPIPDHTEITDVEEGARAFVQSLFPRLGPHLPI
jgi:EpsI family protein